MRNCRFVVAGICLAAFSALAAGQSTGPASQPDDPWASFGLKDVTIGGVMLRYSPEVKDSLPGLRKIIRDALKKERRNYQRNRESIENVDKYIDELHRLIGGEFKKADRRKISNMTRWFLSNANVHLRAGGAETTIVYIPWPLLIRHFRNGGNSLPGLEYDPQNDTLQATIVREIKQKGHNGTSSTRRIPEKQTLAIGPKSVDDPESGLKLLRETVDNCFLASQQGTFGGAFHEAAELMIMERLDWQDPDFYRHRIRWFTDGMANALTVELLERHWGKAAGEAFLDSFDPADIKELRKEANLLHWPRMELACKIRLPATAKLFKARYTYATVEARRLIERHGLGCVKKILDADTEIRSKGKPDLLQAIKQATDEDMLPRLKAYQTFNTIAEGKAKYLKLYKQAEQNANAPAATMALLRLVELRPVAPEEMALAMFYAAKVGDRKSAVKTMINHAKHSRQYGSREEFLNMCSAGCRFFIGINEALSAKPLSDTVLETRPKDPDALAVRMCVMFKQQKRSEARRLAKDIMGIADQGSVAAELARQLLKAYPAEN